jgi:hypothetical protein
MGTLKLDMQDTDNRITIQIAISHAYAPQQAAKADEKAQFFSDVDRAMGFTHGADLNIIIMDANASLGTLPRRNSARRTQQYSSW